MATSYGELPRQRLQGAELAWAEACVQAAVTRAFSPSEGRRPPRGAQNPVSVSGAQHKLGRRRERGLWAGLEV